ncbi:MAG TPA: hypothetical protein VF657_15085 [Actinoplanes sp.]
MSEAIELARYRRLVRAYPAGRRREELLDTMIMAAADGARSRPTVREVVDVWRHAPRVWLGRPGSRAVVVAAVLVAVLTGLVAGCLAAQVTASAQYRPLPTTAALTELGAVVAPGVPLTADVRYDRPVVLLGGEPVYGFARVIAAHDAGTRDTRPYTERVVARLRQAGWQTTWLTETGPYFPDTSDGYEIVVAEKSGVALHFETTRWGDNPTDGHLYLTVQRPVSVWVFVAGGIGAGLGLILGWLLTGWASRRTEHHPSAGRALGVLTAFAVATMAPLVPDMIRGYVAGLSADRLHLESPFWGWTVPGDGFPLFAAPAVLVIGAAVVTAAGRPRLDRSPGSRATLTGSLPKVIGTLVLAAAVAALFADEVIGLSQAILGDRMTLLTVGVTAMVLFRELVAPLRRPGAKEEAQVRALPSSSAPGAGA